MKDLKLFFSLVLFLERMSEPLFSDWELNLNLSFPRFC